jgi:hypothetical protein
MAPATIAAFIIGGKTIDFGFTPIDMNRYTEANLAKKPTLQSWQKPTLRSWQRSTSGPSRG